MAIVLAESGHGGVKREEGQSQRAAAGGGSPQKQGSTPPLSVLLPGTKKCRCEVEVGGAGSARRRGSFKSGACRRCSPTTHTSRTSPTPSVVVVVAVLLLLLLLLLLLSASPRRAPGAAARGPTRGARRPGPGGVEHPRVRLRPRRHLAPGGLAPHQSCAEPRGRRRQHQPLRRRRCRRRQPR